MSGGVPNLQVTVKINSGARLISAHGSDAAPGPGPERAGRDRGPGPERAGQDRGDRRGDRDQVARGTERDSDQSSAAADRGLERSERSGQERSDRPAFDRGNRAGDRPREGGAGGPGPREPGVSYRRRVQRTSQERALGGFEFTVRAAADPTPHGAYGGSHASSPQGTGQGHPGAAMGAWSGHEARTRSDWRQPYTGQQVANGSAADSLPAASAAHGAGSGAAAVPSSPPPLPSSPEPSQPDSEPSRSGAGGAAVPVATASIAEATAPSKLSANVAPFQVSTLVHLPGRRT